MIISVFDRVENIVGKGENAGIKVLVTSIFSFSHNVFKRPLSQTHQKASLCGNGLKQDFVIFRLIDNSGIQSTELQR